VRIFTFNPDLRAAKYQDNPAMGAAKVLHEIEKPVRTLSIVQVNRRLFRQCSSSADIVQKNLEPTQTST
jgi:hypothetical protein